MGVYARAGERRRGGDRERPERPRGGDHARWAAGRSVQAVLQAAGRPGGAVRTEELTLPGFRHDVFSAVYPPPPRRRLSRAGRRAPRPALGAPALLLGRSVAPRPRGGARAQPEETAASPDALPPGDGAPGTSSPAPTSTLRRGRARCSPASHRCAAPRARSPPSGSPARWTFTRLVLMPAQSPGRATSSATAGRARGSTGRRCTATCRPAAPAAPSRPST